MTVETIYGYKIEDLILFAQACKKQGITENDLKDFATNCEYAYKTIKDEMDRLWRVSLQDMSNW